MLVCKNMDNQVIVIGTDHHNTLGIIRSLGEEGKLPIVMLPNLKLAFITKSKYNPLAELKR